MNKLIKYRTPVDDLRDVDENLANDFVRLSIEMDSASESGGSSDGLPDGLGRVDQIARFVVHPV